MGLAVNDNIYLYSATRLQDILAEILSMRPRAVIVDSIQTVYLDDVNGSAGSVSQVSKRDAACYFALQLTICCLLLCPSACLLLPIDLLITLLFGAYCVAHHPAISALCFAYQPAQCCLLFCPSPCLLGPIASCGSSATTGGLLTATCS